VKRVSGGETVLMGGMAMGFCFGFCPLAADRWPDWPEFWRAGLFGGFAGEFFLYRQDLPIVPRLKMAPGKVCLAISWVQ
jgi:hypothetical protein